MTTDYTASVEAAIIGAGPIGLELAVAFKQAGYNYLHFDARQIGQTMTWWPPNTTFFSTPGRIAIAGVPIPNVDQRRITGEQYLAYLRAVVEQFDLQVNTYERVERIIPLDGGGFDLHTRHMRLGKRRYRADHVIMATGGMARPNMLGIPGEALPHVTHYFGDPHKYFRQRLLVVGGRNSAAEAALRCWRAGAQVTISYRRPEIPDKVKVVIRQELTHLIEIGKVGFIPCTVPVEITPECVTLAPTDDEGQPLDADPIHHETDFVLLATGFDADMSLLSTAGVDLSDPFQRPTYDEHTMETNVPGLYLAGTAAGGTQRSGVEHFIETSHHHVIKISQQLAGYTPKIADIPHRNYGFLPEEEEERGEGTPLSHR